MYQVYFSEMSNKPLWHPALTFRVETAEDAKEAALALAATFLTRRWGYGPVDEDGLMEVHP